MQAAHKESLHRWIHCSEAAVPGHSNLQSMQEQKLLLRKLAWIKNSALALPTGRYRLNQTILYMLPQQ